MLVIIAFVYERFLNSLKMFLLSVILKYPSTDCVLTFELHFGAKHFNVSCTRTHITLNNADVMS